MDGSWICRGGYRAPLAFPMSAFARWFAVHPVQAFVWLHAHIEPMSMPACSSAVAASPAGAPPAGSGRFCRKWVPISPWVPGLLCGFRRGLFAVGSADLGKRWHIVAFRADSACETAQKSQAGFAGR